MTTDPDMDKLFNEMTDIAFSKSVKTPAQEMKDFETLRRIINDMYQIRGISPVYTREPSTADIDAFKSWCTRNGIENGHVEFKKTETQGYGVFATRNIPANESVSVVPAKMMIRADLIRKESNPLFSDIPHLALCLNLLVEANDPASGWKEYIDILPRKFSIPMCNLDQVQYLKGTSVYFQIMKDLLNICRQYIHLVHTAKANPNKDILNAVSFAGFMWAKAVCLTRQNQIPIKMSENAGPTMVLCLIPFYDMFNHKQKEAATEFDLATQLAITTSVSQIEQGEQMYINYGSRPNQELFMYSGFIDVSEIRNDCIRLPLNVARTDPLGSKRLLVFERLGIQCPGTFDFSIVSLMNLNEPIPGLSSRRADLVKAVSILQASTDELDDFDPSKQAINLKALNWVHGRCNLLMMNLQAHRAKVPESLPIVQSLYDVEKALLEKMEVIIQAHIKLVGPC